MRLRKPSPLRSPYADFDLCVWTHDPDARPEVPDRSVCYYHRYRYGADDGLLGMMAVVTAISVCPTCAVPVIVGAPVATWLAAALTKMSKVSLTDPPLPSLAVTITETVPTFAACGVPEKVRVVAANISHAGSAVAV